MIIPRKISRFLLHSPTVIRSSLTHITKDLFRLLKSKSPKSALKREVSRASNYRSTNSSGSTAWPSEIFNKCHLYKLHEWRKLEKFSSGKPVQNRPRKVYRAYIADGTRARARVGANRFPRSSMDAVWMCDRSQRLRRMSSTRNLPLHKRVAFRYSESS